MLHATTTSTTTDIFQPSTTTTAVPPVPPVVSTAMATTATTTTTASIPPPPPPPQQQHRGLTDEEIRLIFESLYQETKLDNTNNNKYDDDDDDDDDDCIVRNTNKTKTNEATSTSATNKTTTKRLLPQFVIVPCGPQCEKLSPPPLAFPNGLYVLLRPTTTIIGGNSNRSSSSTTTNTINPTKKTRKKFPKTSNDSPATSMNVDVAATSTVSNAGVGPNHHHHSWTGNNNYHHHYQPATPVSSLSTTTTVAAASTAATSTTLSTVHTDNRTITTATTPKHLQQYPNWLTLSMSTTAPSTTNNHRMNENTNAPTPTVDPRTPVSCHTTITTAGNNSNNNRMTNTGLKWRLSGPQFPPPTAIQQRYCYPICTTATATTTTSTSTSSSASGTTTATTMSPLGVTEEDVSTTAGVGNDKDNTNNNPPQQQQHQRSSTVNYCDSTGGALYTMYSATTGKELLEYRLLHVYYSSKRAGNKGVGAEQKTSTTQAVSPSSVSIRTNNYNKSKPTTSSTSSRSSRSTTPALPHRKRQYNKVVAVKKRPTKSGAIVPTQQQQQQPKRIQSSNTTTTPPNMYQHHSRMRPYYHSPPYAIGSRNNKISTDSSIYNYWSTDYEIRSGPSVRSNMDNQYSNTNDYCYSDYYYESHRNGIDMRCSNNSINSHHHISDIENNIDWDNHHRYNTGGVGSCIYIPSSPADDFMNTTAMIGVTKTPRQPATSTTSHGINNDNLVNNDGSYYNNSQSPSPFRRPIRSSNPPISIQQQRNISPLYSTGLHIHTTLDELDQYNSTELNLSHSPAMSSSTHTSSSSLLLVQPLPLPLLNSRMGASSYDRCTKHSFNWDINDEDNDDDDDECWRSPVPPSRRNYDIDTILSFPNDPFVRTSSYDEFDDAIFSNRTNDCDKSSTNTTDRNNGNHTTPDLIDLFPTSIEIANMNNTNNNNDSIQTFQWTLKYIQDRIRERVMAVSPNPTTTTTTTTAVPTAPLRINQCDNNDNESIPPPVLLLQSKTSTTTEQQQEKEERYCCCCCSSSTTSSSLNHCCWMTNVVSEWAEQVAQNPMSVVVVVQSPQPPPPPP